MNKENEHARYMQRCLDLAIQGLGTTYPNPLVGSVIVWKDKIIGEGFHHRSGEPHAEVLAIRSVKNRDLLKKATLYVNLEPCSHYGKTPPCADLIVKTGIPRVVVGTLDTTEKVQGKGIRKMQEGGVEVITGVLEQASRFVNRRFFTYHEKKRPYIILKWAESVDGYLDEERTDGQQVPNWISGPLGRQLVHKWRSEEQAILIGRKTALIDNPALTAREWYGRNPLRLVIDRELTLPSNLQLFDDEAPTIIFNNLREEKHTHPEPVRIDFNKPVIPQITEELYSRQIQSLIVEGGAYTLRQYIESGMWDEARVFKGNRYFYAGVKAPVLKRQPSRIFHTGDSTYHLFFNDTYL
ncbi:MAG TPA: bifunctional diaminohydroxyphosphoribosylaminopyrimidine deaminase/5-amino-6-(5-phosphoribosylamino)uracil reductase RibD [Bacteroidetes bacterium]|nr:bifunctional diaminohydroxyphosphoribosylaminopyrimidine deaminase/5-amino-6-(5-phosphoribosylamino)uracil reductase RibD [Bacteroidota bacterium]